MNLNEQLNKMKSMMGLQAINEYVTQHDVYLRDYFNMTEEQKKNSLPFMYPWMFSDFLEEKDIEFKRPTKAYIDADGEEQPGDEYEDYEIVDIIQQKDKPVFDAFADYLFDKVERNELSVDDTEYPAWSYITHPRLITNQWLIHFTEEPWKIAREGFTRGVSELDKLHLTTRLGEFDKKYGGYNFAFRADIYKRYARRGYMHEGGYKYGNEAVMFIGSGIEIIHHGDEEPQVIFWGKKARNIVPITLEYGDDYAVHNIKKGGVVYKSQDLDDVVSWVMRNYDRYKNVIQYEPTRTKEPDKY